MKKTAKITSLVLALAMMVTSFAGFSTTAFAAGWIDYVKSADLNTWYSDSFDTTDCKILQGSSYYDYYDAYSFTLSERGNVKISLRGYGEDRDELSSTQLTLYKSSDLSSPLYEGSELYYRFDGEVKENTAYGYTYYDLSKTLPAGTYYLTIQLYENIVRNYNWSYDISFNYTPSIANTSLKKVTAKKKAFKATWRKCSGVSGYQIQYSTKKNMKSSKKVKVSSSSSSKTIKKLKKKKKYYVRIRTYKTVEVNGERKTYYGKWSGKKTVKTK